MSLLKNFKIVKVDKKFRINESWVVPAPAEMFRCQAVNPLELMLRPEDYWSREHLASGGHER